MQQCGSATAGQLEHTCDQCRPACDQSLWTAQLPRQISVFGSWWIDWVVLRVEAVVLHGLRAAWWTQWCVSWWVEWCLVD
jgi:hypothetical protein